MPEYEPDTLLPPKHVWDSVVLYTYLALRFTKVRKNIGDRSFSKTVAGCTTIVLQGIFRKVVLATIVP